MCIHDYIWVNDNATSTMVPAIQFAYKAHKVHRSKLTLTHPMAYNIHTCYISVINLKIIEIQQSFQVLMAVHVYST